MFEQFLLRSIDPMLEFFTSMGFECVGKRQREGIRTQALEMFSWEAVRSPPGVGSPGVGIHMERRLTCEKQTFLLASSAVVVPFFHAHGGPSPVSLGRCSSRSHVQASEGFYS